MKNRWINVVAVFACLLCAGCRGNGRLAGGDWRTNGLISDRGTVEVDGVTTDVLLCLSSKEAALYYDDDTQTVFAVLRYPHALQDARDSYSSFSLLDRNNDGKGDAHLVFVHSDGSKTEWTWRWDNGEYRFDSELNSKLPEAMPDDFDLAVEDLPKELPDVLNLRKKEYGKTPLFEIQEQVTEYALWNFLNGRMEFECRLSRDLSHNMTAVALENACNAAMSYYLFSAYHVWDMYTEDDGKPDSVYAKVKLDPDPPERDWEARAEALEFVMKNPVPIGGFTDYAREKQYARKIHDFVACKVTYDPRGYDPKSLSGGTRYDDLQEAYNVLGEDQTTAVCAGYARAFALIAQYAGINCAWVMGNETEESSHAWNVIYPCDGSEPVLVDVTWDDGLSQDVVGQTEVEDTYFYLPLSTEQEHQADKNMSDFLQYINANRP